MNTTLFLAVAYFRLLLSGFIIPFILGYAVSDLFKSLSRSRFILLNFFLVLCYFLIIKIVLSNYFTALALKHITGFPYLMLSPRTLFLMFLIPYLLGMGFSLSSVTMKK